MRVVDKSISPWSEEGLPQGRRRVGTCVPGGENRVGRGREARGRGMPRDPWPGSGRAGKCPEGQRGPLRAEAGAPPSSRMTPAPSCSWSLGTRRPRCNSRLSASLGPLQDPLPQPSLPRTGSYTVCLPGVHGGASDRPGSPPPWSPRSVSTPRPLRVARPAREPAGKVPGGSADRCSRINGVFCRATVQCLKETGQPRRGKSQ